MYDIKVEPDISFCVKALVPKYFRQKQSSEQKKVFRKGNPFSRLRPNYDSLKVKGDFVKFLCVFVLQNSLGLHERTTFFEKEAKVMTS